MTVGVAFAAAAAATAGVDESISADGVDEVAVEDAAAGMEGVFPDKAFEEEDALDCFVDDVDDKVNGCESLSISLGGSNGVTLKGGWG